MLLSITTTHRPASDLGYLLHKYPDRYGHTPVPEPEWPNNTVNIDTGCVFGGKLTALRYPEREFVSVPAAKTYCEPARPFLPTDQQAPKLSAQQAHDFLDRVRAAISAADNLNRLRSRGLAHKRSLALGEFALGVEGLERFVRREPLRRVHECVFGVLALESEPVDPRL